jgi:WD40 repeat protein/transcriptional regulator with XRE-family HTH domain
VTQVDKQQPWNQKLRRERTKHGWSQADVASRIQSNTKTVSRWEQGKAFPGPYLRQKLAEIFDKSIEELGLVVEQASEYIAIEAADIASGKEDWGEAPSIEDFYGRTRELAELEQWIVGDRCRLIGVLGMGGIGKTTFATTIAKRVQDSFDLLFWRSLQHVPPVESILENYLQFVFHQRHLLIPKDLEGQLSLLVTCLREHRSLLILDNVESVLEAGRSAGQYKQGFEGYGRLFQRVGEASHSSCLIITSREKPRELARLDEKTSAVRVLELRGVEQREGKQLLKDSGLFGTEETWGKLVHVYGGNPLALQLAREPIREVFRGDIADFLGEGATVFGDIDGLLEEQFERLGVLEQEVLYWLAIAREATSLQELRVLILAEAPRGALLEALDSLRRRCMIEIAEGGGFSLQPVIMEYVTARFVELIYEELVSEKPSLLERYALMEASAKDYVRASQVHFIVAVLIERLLVSYGKAGSEEKLERILSMLRTMGIHKPGYAPGNILNLLVQSGADLRDINFSELTVKQAYLQDMNLAGVNFAHANLATCVFTDTFSSMLCVALSPDGKLLATGTTTGEISIWEADVGNLRFTRSEHSDWIRSVAFSPDGKVLVSGSEDATVRLWDTSSGECSNVLRGHGRPVHSVSFSPDGWTIASGSEDATVRTWDATTGRCLTILHGHQGWVRCVAFSSDGNILASGGDDTTVRLWETSSGLCFNILEGHNDAVRALTFSPQGGALASGSYDTTVCIWDTNKGDCIQVLHRHTDRVRALAYSADGRILASSSDDTTIQLSDSSSGKSLKTLYGHTSRIWSIVFFPSSKVLVSVSEDETLRFWEVQSGECIRTIRGYSSLIKAVAFSPDGQMLVSGSEDQLVRLWKVESGQCAKTLRGHTHRVRCVAFSPDGGSAASGSEDETIRIWDLSTGTCLNVLRGHTHLVRSMTYNYDGSLIVSGSYDHTIRVWDTHTGNCLKMLRGEGGVIWSVAFSPDGSTIASGGDDAIIHIWDANTGKHLNSLEGHKDRVWFVAFSPDGSMIASASDDATICIWDMGTGTCIHTLSGHNSWVRCLAFGPDGRIIASGSHDATIRIWDIAQGYCLKILHGHSKYVWSVAFSPDGKIIASSSDDGTIGLWDVATGARIRTLRSERPYEGMNITGVTGLTEAQKMSLKALGSIEVV